MIKTISIGLAIFVVVALGGASQAQLFIEDFDTYTGWSGGEETPAASKSGGLATNGWVKAQMGGTRQTVGAIRNNGIGGSQAGGQTFDPLAYQGTAARDITGEVNPNGNYMVRTLINPGTSVAGVQGNISIQIGDGTSTFDRFSNQSVLYAHFVFNEDTVHQVNGTVAHSDRIDLHGAVNGSRLLDDFKSGDPGECALNPNWDSTNPDAANQEFLLLETGDAPCRPGASHGDVVAYFDYTKYGDWMETLVNINMNNEVGTLWLRDVDDTTGEATESWERFPWNFPLGTGSTIGIPFSAPEGLAWGVAIPLRNTVSEAFLVDNIISGHPLLSGQGDFDGDGDIDGNDFLIWQNNFPTTDGTAISFSGDANGDGNVDGDDFLIWQNNFPYPAALSKTPEPASLGLLALGGLLMLRHRRETR